MCVSRQMIETLCERRRQRSLVNLGKRTCFCMRVSQLISAKDKIFVKDKRYECSDSTSAAHFSTLFHAESTPQRPHVNLVFFGRTPYFSTLRLPERLQHACTHIQRVPYVRRAREASRIDN